jgi:hypothetical protein
MQLFFEVRTQEPAMETLTRLVTESLARHGFDRPIDYRRLQWSHWFRCESHHSLLIVPSKPGVFALAEEVMSIPDHVGTDPLVRPANPILSEAKEKGSGPIPAAESRTPEADSTRRMLAVTRFFEDDDMAYVLDRMLSQQNPMRERLTSGRYFVRFVVIEDPSQRRTICSALNQWIASSAERATGIGSHFATSLELMPGAEQACVATAASAVPRSEASGPGTSLESSKPSDGGRPVTAPRLNSAIATTIHCSSSFPSGF